jgi:hypothetical protein
MHLLPFESPVANLLVITLYSILVGAAANITVAAGFNVFDRSKTRRR